MKTRSTRQPRQPVPSRPAASGGSALLPGAGLVLLAFLVYAPALGAGFIWDDNTLAANPLLHSWRGLWRIWTRPGLITLEEHYWPLVYSSFWLERLVGGLNPALLHFDNILLHAAVCVLLWRVLLRLEVPGAWLGAALFAVHPVHAESVAWVIERKDVLSGVFYLGAALAYIQCGMRNAECGINPQLTTHNPQLTTHSHFPMAAFALFAAALLSKSIVVTLPVALALVLWWRRGRLALRDLASLAPFVLLAGAVTLADLHFGRGLQERAIENSGLAFPERLLMAGRALWVYLGKLAWPYPLAMFYPQWPVSRAAPASWMPLFAWPALLAILWLGRRRIGRGPSVAVVFYGLTLAPALGAIDFEFLHYSWVADRFQYLASAGPLALAAAALTRLARRRQWPANAARWAAGLALAALGLLGLRQASLYHDAVTFYRAGAAAYPQCWAAHVNYGLALRQAGRGTEAIEALQQALKVLPRPDHHLTLELAKTYDLQGQYPEADRWFRETLRLRPDFPLGRIGYGVFLAARGDLAGAVAQYQEELRLNPGDSVCLNNLGNTLRTQGKLEEAEEVLSRAAGLKPQYVDCQANLALVLLDRGKYAPAAEQCRLALDIAPDHFTSLVTLGQALLAQRQAGEAMAPLARALKLQPRSPDALYLIGEAYAALRDIPAAIRYYQEVLKLKPDDADAAGRLRELGAKQAQ